MTTLTRYCTSCGRVGDIHPPALACCPEHHGAVSWVPRLVAEQARAGFIAALRLGDPPPWLGLGHNPRPAHAAPPPPVARHVHLWPSLGAALRRAPDTPDPPALPVRLCSTCANVSTDGHAEPCFSCLQVGAMRTNWTAERRECSTCSHRNTPPGNTRCSICTEFGGLTKWEPST